MGAPEGRPRPIQQPKPVKPNPDSGPPKPPRGK